MRKQTPGNKNKGRFLIVEPAMISTGMDFADAFAQVKGKLGAKSRQAKSGVTLDPEEQLANWRTQMTQDERASLKVESVKGTASQYLLERPLATSLSLEHL